MSSKEDVNRLRAAVEATRLNFGLTTADVRRMLLGAESLGVAGVCLPVGYVTEAARFTRSIAAWKPDVVSVANFPTGDHGLRIVVEQARRAVTRGAHHVDLVVPGGLVREHRWKEVREFVTRVRERAESAADRPVFLKVILETAALEEAEIRGAAECSIEGGARWLKTSTGFHPAGGATAGIVALLREIAPGGVGIKASGGIRTRAAALEMLAAGADRIGTSSEAEILGASSEME
jgi:deoxyribose-phosphate aldolase